MYIYTYIIHTYIYMQYTQHIHVYNYIYTPMVCISVVQAFVSAKFQMTSLLLQLGMLNGEDSKSCPQCFTNKEWLHQRIYANYLD